MSQVTDDIIRLYVESDALTLADHVRRGDVTGGELIETAIGLIEKIDPQINSVVIPTFDYARQSSTKEGPFAGVPFLLKNVGSTCAGIPLDLGLACLRDQVWDADTEMVRRIRQSGLAIVGRTNLPECGWSVGTENRLYGATRNPWDISKTPGGSSGGAAAAVAARLVPIAEASDGAGSIRVPASCCGVVGLKTSRGRITYGPQAVDTWFGSISTLCNTRTVRDTAAFLDATAGTMTGDLYNPAKQSQSWLSLLDEKPRRLRIGYTLHNPWGEAVSAEVRQSVEQSLALFETLGHDIERYDIAEDLEAAWWRYNDIVAVEYAGEFAQYGRLVGRPLTEADLCPINWSMIEHASTLSATDYSASIAANRKTSQKLAIELSQFDVYVTPTLTHLPRPVNYWSMEEADRETYLNRWSDAAYMFAFNVSGHPAISVPGTPSGSGLPIGTHLVGQHGDEATILQLARQMEEAAPWIDRIPAVCAGRENVIS